MNKMIRKCTWKEMLAGLSDNDETTMRALRFAHSSRQWTVWLEHKRTRSIHIGATPVDSSLNCTALQLRVVDSLLDITKYFVTKPAEDFLDFRQNCPYFAGVHQITTDNEFARSTRVGHVSVFRGVLLWCLPLFTMGVCRASRRICQARSQTRIAIGLVAVMLAHFNVYATV